jgi:hypothetical protein
MVDGPCHLQYQDLLLPSSVSTDSEGTHKGMKRFTAFAASVYTKAWFSATSAIAAPACDLPLLKRLISYPDSKIAKATSKKVF